ncbi:MAG: insulinase family protein [Gammaproteobacteria bacterium]|nr:insulinase family protein [Gammaproteobacteria bacterium]
MPSSSFAKLIFISSALILWLLGCATTESPEPMATSDEVTITKSPNDSRSYRYLKLDNELTAILVHRTEEGKAGAALGVARGSNHDWPEYEGIAHFLEHMLFLGTEKYPGPDGYSEFISKHGGNRNAYTASELTNYYFDIDEQQFPEALDRFAQFFTAPLLDDTYVEREKNAVHSEYQMQLRSDTWRGMSVSKTVMNPDHPMSKFNIGSNETLADVDRDLVKDFYEQNYSADQMVLVVVSERSLDDQEALVRELFGDVPNRRLGDAPIPPLAYRDDSLPFAYGYQTIMSNRSISIEWPVPDYTPYLRTKPLNYLGNLIGHEGEGSLHQLLQNRGWINSLSAGGFRSDRGNSEFGVSVGVTDSGWEHLDEILGLVYAYIETLRANPIEEWRYHEQATIADLNFRFVEQTSSIGTANQIVNNAQIFEPEDLLRGPYLMTKFESRVIRDYLSYLTRENAITRIAAPDIETDKTEKWFSVPYTLTPDINTNHVVEHSFELPEPNVYIPDETSVLDGLHDAIPSIVHDADGLEVWHAPNTEFKVPRAYITVRLQYAEPLSRPREVVNNVLLSRLLNIKFNARSYPAVIAGLYGNFGTHSEGLSITVNGYDDKQSLLLGDMLKLLNDFEVDEAQLENQKVELAKQYSDFKDVRPFQQAFSTISHTLMSSAWAPSVLAAEVSGVTSESLSEWMAERLDQVAATVLIVGNVTAEAGKGIGKTIADSLNLEASERRVPSVHRLSELHTRNLDIEHNDAVYLVSFQGEENSIAERAVMRLIASVVSTAYFNDLRTEQQLGYATIAQFAELFTFPSMVFVVQSPVADVPHIQTATNQFIAKRRIELDSMTQEEFDGYKDGLLTSLLEKDRNLSQKSGRYLNDLVIQNPSFDTREQLANAIRDITLDDFRVAYDRLLDLDSPRRLEVFSPGQKGSTLTQGVAITDPTIFKQPD